MCDRALATGGPYLLDVQIDDQQVLFELRAGRKNVPVGPGDHASAVENKFVLPANLVDVRHERPIAPGGGGYEPLPRLTLVDFKWGPVDVDDQLGAGLTLDLRRSGRLPNVFANVEADSAVSEVGHGAYGAGHEVAPFVEHPVIGQVDLVVHALHVAVGDEGQRVEQMPVHFVDEPHDGRDVFDLNGQLLQKSPVFGHE